MALLCAFCSFLLGSCQQYEPYTLEEVFRGAYGRNFIHTYGDIDPSVDWDFTDETPLLRESFSMTRAGADELDKIVNESGYFTVDEIMTKEITSLLDNQITDKSFAFLIGENDCFDVFPVYITPEYTGKVKWALQMYVDNQAIIPTSQDYPGWGMEENVQAKYSANDIFQKFSKSRAYNGDGLRSKSIKRYENSGEKKLMHLALVIGPKNSNDNYAYRGSKQSSLHYQMKILDIPKPAIIGERLETLFVACEATDVSLQTGIRYKSLVLMIVGPRIPKVLYVRNDEQGRGWVDESGSSKRYMIEDLGSSSDFDFNDIVVDVEDGGRSTPVSLEQKEFKGTSAKLTTVSFGEPQVSAAHATLRFLCGTRPFRLYVGDSSFGLVTDPTNQQQTCLQLLNQELEGEATYFGGSKGVVGWEPDTRIDVEGWTSTNNKVSVMVWPKGDVTDENTTGGWTVQFPKVGEVPFMMALPTSTQWSAEGMQFTDWQRYVPGSDDVF